VHCNSQLDYGGRILLFILQIWTAYWDTSDTGPAIQILRNITHSRPPKCIWCFCAHRLTAPVRLKIDVLREQRTDQSTLYQGGISY